MGILRKRDKIDVIDFTDLQKRGILKQDFSNNFDSSDYSDGDGTLDFTKQGNFLSRKSDSSNGSSGSSAVSSGSFDFLGNLAGASTSSVSNVSENSGLEFQGLKNKFEDLEYKFERLMEKLTEIETKILNFEKNTR